MAETVAPVPREVVLRLPQPEEAPAPPTAADTVETIDVAVAAPVDPGLRRFETPRPVVTGVQLPPPGAVVATAPVWKPGDESKYWRDSDKPIEIRIHEAGDKNPVVMTLTPTAGAGTEAVSGKVRASWKHVWTSTMDGTYRVTENHSERLRVGLIVDGNPVNLAIIDGKATMSGGSGEEAWTQPNLDVIQEAGRFRLVYQDGEGDQQTLTWPSR